MVGVFCQRPDATVQQAIFLVVDLKALSIIPGKPAAIEPGPHRAVVGDEYRHGEIVRQSIGGGEHSRGTICEPVKPVSVRANPQVAIAIAVHVTHLHACGHQFQAGGGGPKQPLSPGKPYPPPRIFIDAECRMPLRTPGLQLFNSSTNPARHTVLGAEPGNAMAVFENVKYLCGFYTQLSFQLRVQHNPRAIPFHGRSSGRSDPEMAACGFLDAVDEGSWYSWRKNAVLEAVKPGS